MQGKELCQQILGLSSPWQVTSVDLDQKSRMIRCKVCAIIAWLLQSE